MMLSNDVMRFIRQCKTPHAGKCERDHTGFLIILFLEKKETAARLFSTAQLLITPRAFDHEIFVKIFVDARLQENADGICFSAKSNRKLLDRYLRSDALVC